MRRGSLLAHVAWPFFVGASCVILRVVCEAISSTNLWCSRRPDVVHPGTRFRTWIQRVNLLDSAGFRETAAAPSFWQSSLRPHAVTLSSPPSSPWFCHHVVISIPDDHDLEGGKRNQNHIRSPSRTWRFSPSVTRVSLQLFYVEFLSPSQTMRY